MKKLLSLILVAIAVSLGFYACDNPETATPSGSNPTTERRSQIRFRNARLTTQTAVSSSTVVYSPDPTTPYPGWVASTGSPIMSGVQSALVSVDAGETLIMYPQGMENADSVTYTFVSNGAAVFTWVERWLGLGGLHIKVQAHDPFGESVMTLDSLLTICGNNDPTVTGAFEVTAYGNAQASATYLTPQYNFNR